MAAKKTVFCATFHALQEGRKENGEMLPLQQCSSNQEGRMYDAATISLRSGCHKYSLVRRARENTQSGGVQSVPEDAQQVRILADRLDGLTKVRNVFLLFSGFKTILVLLSACSPVSQLSTLNILPPIGGYGHDSQSPVGSKLHDISLATDCTEMHDSHVQV